MTGKRFAGGKEIQAMGIEIEILDWIQTIRTPFLDDLMRFITNLGNLGIIWILFAVSLLLVSRTRGTGLKTLAALAVDAVLCNGVLKLLFARIRPCDVNTAIQLLIPRPDDFSFPSGHTAAAFAVVTALFLSGEKRLWKPALVLAVLMAFSRLYLYVHYPTDVLGGILAGVISGYAGVWCGERLLSARIRISK